MSKHLQHQIEALKQKILLVGTLVEDAIAKAISALVNRNGDLARSIIERDCDIDRMEVDVEEECLKVLALYQPVAADLRFVVAVLKINNDLERMGDLAGISPSVWPTWPRTRELNCPPSSVAWPRRPNPWCAAAWTSPVNRDTLIARQIRDDDDEVDAMQRLIRDRIESQIRQQPDKLDLYMRLLSVSRHLERLADMSTNVAEDVIYMVEGDIVRHRAGD